MPDDYEVGYRKPPKHTQFKPGQSGNPRGRPKGTKNLKTDLREELDEQIVVREGGRAQRVSKQRAMVKTIMARALKGDVRALTLQVNMISQLFDPDDGAGDIAQPLKDDDLEILRAYEERIRRTAGDAHAPDAPEGQAEPT